MTSRPPPRPCRSPSPQPSRQGSGRSCLRRRPRLGATPGARSHHRAISQLYSTCVTSASPPAGSPSTGLPPGPPDPASADFPRHVTSGARW